MNRQSKTQLIAVFGYLNNHATAALEELRRVHPDMPVTFFYWLDFPDFRSENDWDVPRGATKLSFLRPFSLICHGWSILRAQNLYFHGFTTPRGWMAALLWLVVCFGNCSNILLASEGLKKSPSPLKKFLLRMLLNSRKVVHLGIGHGSSQDYLECGLNKWNFLKYCFCENYPPSIELRKDTRAKFRILSVGQLIERKNHKRLIRAIAKLKEPSNVAVDIAGTGEQHHLLVAEAKRLGVSDQINFLGFCDHQILNQLFANADVFVLQSHYDGWGVVVGHAAHFGLPIIASSRVRSGKDFLVEINGNGFITETENQLAEKLQMLIDNDNLAEQMGKRSKELSELWKVQTVAGRLYQFLSDKEVKFDCGPLSIAINNNESNQKISL